MKDYRQSMAVKRESVFSRHKPPDRFIKSQMVSPKCIYRGVTLNGVSRVYVYIYTHVTHINTLI